MAARTSGDGSNLCTTSGCDIPASRWRRRSLAPLKGCGLRSPPLDRASDAHEPGGTGWGFDQITEYARDIGYRERAVFRERAHSSVPL